MARRRGSPATGKAEPAGGLQPSAAKQMPADTAEAGGTILHSRIAARAYALSLARGGQQGDDWADWFQAEREVLAEERPAPDPDGP